MQLSKIKKLFLLNMLFIFNLIQPGLLNSLSFDSESDGCYEENEISLFFKTKSVEDTKKLIPNLEIIYQIPFYNNTVKIYHDNKTKDTKYEHEKLIVVFDKQNNILNYKVVVFITGTQYSFYHTEDKFCLEVDYTNTITNKFIMEYICVMDKEPYIKSFPLKNRWVASGLIKDSYILYSTEFESSSIKKIDINTGDVTLYDYEYDFPNVELYIGLPAVAAKDDCLGIFKYNGKWYEIYDNEIISTDYEYNVEAKKKLSEFKVNEL